MKKGIIGAIIIFFVIAIAVAVISYALGSMLSRQGIAKRGLFEASIISESDKVETYTRSFLRATDLSSLQAIYDSGTEYVVLPYDFGAVYSEKYKMSYWQIYDETANRMPPPEIMVNKAMQEISWLSSCYMYNYLKAFRNFSENAGYEVFIPDPASSSPIIARVTNIDDETVDIVSDEISFRKSVKIEDRGIDVDRIFKSFSYINTKFRKTIDIAWNIISNDELGKCVKNISCSYDGNNNDTLQTNLNSLSSNFKENDINVIFELKDFDYDGTNAKAVINVSIYHNSTNYTLYSFPNDNVKIWFLGVNFLVKVGNKIDDVDERIISGLPDFHDCMVSSGYSNLGIISPKTSDEEICKFFNIFNLGQIPCQDTDGGLNYVAAGTCTDFTGSYADLCFDLDKSGEDETLYEYEKYLSTNICRFVPHLCTSGCVNNACEIACDIDTDCNDNNVCTKDVCHDGGLDSAWCENSPEPPTTSCDTASRDCSSSNCACEGDDWVCETDTDKTCTRYCDGAGGCGDCTPPACDKVDRGCCVDSDCPVGTPLCHLPTHTCYRCLTDSDCPQDGYNCNVNLKEYWDNYCNPGPGDCGHTVISSTNCNSLDGTWCNGNTKETRDYSCTGVGPNADCTPSVSATEDCNSYDKYYCYDDNIREYRDFSCSGSGPSATCSYSYSDRRTCSYGCRNSDRCWEGFDCPEKTCSYSETKWCCLARCYGEDSCTVSGCYPEWNMLRVGNWVGASCSYWCDFDYPCWFPCSAGECVWTDTCYCIATCSYSDACTYV